MQLGREDGAAPSRSKQKWLIIGLAISIAAAAASLTGYYYNSLELAARSELVSRQQLEIQANSEAIKALNLEIEQKLAELEQADTTVSNLEQELSTTEMELGEQSEAAALLRAELDDASEQAILLETEIIALQSKINTDEQRIQELTVKASSAKVTVSHYGLGVDQNDRGTVFPIKVEIIESGSGVLSVDINNVQYEPGFQVAVRAAAEAASQYTGTSISDKDIIVRFAQGSAQLDSDLRVDGSSAGAIIAAMIAAGLSGKDLDTSIMVTGSISDDGQVGRVGGLEEKLIAAEDFGAEAMIVPESQEFESASIPVIGVADLGELMEMLEAS